MKVIDLLNKIANNEEVPKKVVYYGIDYIYDESDSTYYNDNDKTLLETYNFNILNDEVEIIKEDNKIEKIKSLNNVNNYGDLIEFKNKQQLNNHILKDKINGIIDEINKLKENK